MIYKRIRFKGNSPLALAPLVDVVFLLLVFFVSSYRMTGIYSAVNVKDLPKSDFVSYVESDLILSINAEGQIFTDEYEIPLDSLYSFLCGKEDKGRITVVSDKNVNVGYVIFIIGVAKSAGFKEVNIGTAKNVN
ncbi:MAG TPA: hypothetical protein DEP20_02490 [Fusobacteria bacterium]|nr:hypothetical protein [Fusobacteriota bacterium]|tara:strand:- start:6013 stop:6414 length:402 start_codon:yes stop_codon:yes gene_type:complete